MNYDQNLIYDIGMHRGEDTGFYLRKGFKVIGFEANPHLVEQCKIRFQAAIAAGRLHLIEGAIAPEALGEAIKFFISSISTWGTLNSTWVDRNKVLGAELRK